MKNTGTLQVSTPTDRELRLAGRTPTNRELRLAGSVMKVAEYGVKIEHAHRSVFIWGPQWGPSSIALPPSRPRGPRSA